MKFWPIKTTALVSLIVFCVWILLWTSVYAFDDTDYDVDYDIEYEEGDEEGDEEDVFEDEWFDQEEIWWEDQEWEYYNDEDDFDSNDDEWDVDYEEDFLFEEEDDDEEYRDWLSDYEEFEETFLENLENLDGSDDWSFSVRDGNEDVEYGDESDLGIKEFDLPAEERERLEEIYRESLEEEVNDDDHEYEYIDDKNHEEDEWDDEINYIWEDDLWSLFPDWDNEEWDIDYDDEYEDDEDYGDPFEDLEDDEREEIEEEFERHDEQLELLRDQYEDASTYQERNAIQKAVIQEVEEHVDVISPYVSQDWYDLLKEEKVRSLEDISDVDFFEAFDDEWEDEENRDDDFFEDPFEDLEEEEREEVEEEFERHEDTIEDLFERFEDADSQAKQVAIQEVMIKEIDAHFEALHQYVPEDEKIYLDKEKQDYIKYIADGEFYDDNHEDDFYQDSYEDDDDDDREEMIFGKEREWDVIDDIFEFHELQLDELFDELEDNIQRWSEVTETKKKLLNIAEKMHTSLLPHSTEEGRNILDEEKAALIDYVENFEEYDEEEYEDEDGEGFPVLKDLTNKELSDLDSLRSIHEQKMNALYDELEKTDETWAHTVKIKLLTEIEDIYTKMMPYISDETLEYLEEEKQDYKRFIEEEAMYMCCGRAADRGESEEKG